MDAQAHALIDVLQQRIILEQCRLVADHILVESHCRTSLSFSWRQRMHLLRRLVYQREHHLERNTMLLQQLLTDDITVVDEIADEDSRQMEILSILRRKFIHAPTQLMRQLLYHPMGITVVSLYETRDNGEIHLLFLGERLHRIEDAVMQRHPLEHVHRE